VTPLEALTGRCSNVAGFRVSGSPAWALKPKKQQRKPEPRTDVGRLVGYTVCGRAYHILEDGTNKVLERRDVLMEEKPTKAGISPGGSSAGPQLTMTEDSAKNGSMDGAMDMLDAEGDGAEKHLLEEDSESDSDGDPDDLADDEDDEEGQGYTCSGSCPQSQRGITPSENPAQDADRYAGVTTRTPGSLGAKRTKTTEATQTQR